VLTWTALCILDEIEAFSDPKVPQICTYLQSITTSEGGVPFVLPSAHAYPSAPWWQSAEPPSGSLNPTAAIAALLYKHGVEHPWLSAATDYCWRQLDAMDQSDPYQMRAVLSFLEYVPDRERAERAFAHIGPQILEQGLVALDPAASDEEEMHTPLNFAPRPQSLARRLFSDAVIDAHLEALAAAQQEDGGWQFNWQAWNAATTLEWRGIVTIEARRVASAYGRLP
jgi:hypothetical protein